MCVCTECGKPFKTTNKDVNKCFDCTIKKYPLRACDGKAYEWADLVEAYNISGQKIPQKYIKLHNQNARELEKEIRHKFRIDIRIGSPKFTREEEAIIERL